MSDSRANQLPTEAEERKRPPFMVDLVVRLVKEKPLGTVGGIIVLLLFLTGIFADFLAPYGINEIHLKDQLSPPSFQYLLGTDNLGRDQLSRIIHGARISMIVGLSAASLSLFISIIIGLPSGFFGGKYDLVVQRFVDAFFCLPWLFFILSVMALLGPGMVQVIVVLGIYSGVHSSRLTRSTVIGIKENVYVEAARAIGCPPIRLLTKHILPNIAAPLIIIFTVYMGSAILTEATISFLGFGIPPPIPSWGGMISAEGREFLADAPWLAIWPGVALGVVIYGINMLGDGLRDILDPRLRGGLGRYGRVKAGKPKLAS